METMQMPIPPKTAAEEDCTYCYSFNKNGAKGEVVFYEDEQLRIMRAFELKGHRERLVGQYKQHGNNLTDEQKAFVRNKLREVALPIFAKFTDLESIAVLEPTKSRFFGHWHAVACELNPRTQDYKQIVEQTKYDEVKLR
jgi:hypothetical protein